MTSLISIIIPCYNADKYLKDTIQSVINQTYSNWELIIVNDGSTDSSLNIIKAFSEKDARILYINKSNSGVSDSRNKGIENAKGDFIAFLDADDVWNTDFLKWCLSKFSEETLLGLVHTDNQIINEKSERLNQINESFDGFILNQLLLGGEGEYIFAISSCLIKKEVIETVGGFDTQLSNSADHEFYFRVANQYKIGRIPSIGIYYRIHSTNMHSNLLLFEADLIKSYQKASKNSLFKSFLFKQKCFSNMYLILAGSWWKNGKNKTKGIVYLFKSIFTYPPVIFRLIKKLI